MHDGGICSARPLPLREDRHWVPRVQSAHLQAGRGRAACCDRKPGHLVYHRRMMRFAQRWILVLALPFVGGCTSEGEILIVNVRTDLSPTGEFAAVRTELARGEAQVGWSQRVK